MNARVQDFPGLNPAHLLISQTNRPSLKPDEIRNSLRRWCNSCNEEGEIWLKNSPEAGEWEKYKDQLIGKQWTTRRPQSKASPVNNLLLRSLEQTIAVQTDLRLAFQVSSSDENFTQTANLLTKTGKAWWINQDVDLDLAQGLIYAYMSTGYLRYYWNPRLFGGKGDFQTAAEDINAIMPIGPASQRLQDWEGVIYTTYRPLNWFQVNYPKRWALVAPNSRLSQYPVSTPVPGFMNRAAFAAASPAMRRIIGGGTSIEYRESVMPVAKYSQFWIRDHSLNESENVATMGREGTNWCYAVKPGQPLYPRGRLICTGGDDFQILDDTPNFYWHGRWPFIDLRAKPMPWQFHGCSELRTKIPLQSIVNNVLAAILDMAKKAVNPALLYPDSSFAPNLIKNLDITAPGLKLGYAANQSLNKPEWSQAPQLPQFVYLLLQYAEQQLQDDAGLLDLPGMARKKVSPAGDTLAELKEGQQLIMRLRGRYIEHAVQELGEQMTPNFMQFYTLARRIAMFGIKGGTTPEDVIDWNPNTMIPAGVSPIDFSRNFAFQITPNSLLNSSRQDIAMLFMALRRQADVDRKTLFEKLDLAPIYEQVEQGLSKEKEQSLREAVVSALIQASPALAALFTTGDANAINIGGGGLPAGGNGGAAPALNPSAPGNPGGTGAPFPGGKGSKSAANLLTPER